MKLLSSFFYNLVYPFRAHEYYKGKVVNVFDENHVWKLNLYESISLSWLFVIINGLLRILFIHTIINMFVGDSPTVMGIELWPSDHFSSFYFILISIVLDMVFHPLFTLIMVQIWELIIKAYAHVLEIEGDWDEIAESIMTVSLSSYFFKIIPFIGDFLQSIFKFILMYSGLRVRLGASRMLTLVILLTPIWFLTFIFIVVSVFFMLFL
jgi:hypothetical protein